MNSINEQLAAAFERAYFGTQGAGSGAGYNGWSIQRDGGTFYLCREGVRHGKVLKLQLAAYLLPKEHELALAQLDGGEPHHPLVWVAAINAVALAVNRQRTLTTPDAWQVRDITAPWRDWALDGSNPRLI